MPDQSQGEKKDERLTDEVASEGGTPGDLELEPEKGPGRGSEATQVWDSGQTGIEEIRRDDTGPGRRGPV